MSSSPLPGTSRLICVSNKEHRRFSEADVIELTDGRLFLAVGRKQGGSDYAPGVIIGMFSEDGGLSWDDAPRVVQAPFNDVTDLMSVSLCRSSRGIHLFFLGRGKDGKKDTRVYQMLSNDEAKTWGKPQRVNKREGYHIVNNARVTLTNSGRMIVPAAYIEDVGKNYDGQRIYCMLSDDQGQTWRESSELVLEKRALMEPGVAQCHDGSLYMTIRTKLKKLWEARSNDDGATWVDFKESPLPSPAAPSTVMRDPNSEALWMFWCNRPDADWKGRSRQVFAISKDNGKTWGEPRVIEEDPKGSFGYISVDLIKEHVLLTYYDWRDHGQPGFEQTSLRQRTIPLRWFSGEVVPPVFAKVSIPVLKQDQPWEGKMVAANSGLVVEPGRWRLWYTNGTASTASESLRVCSAESLDAGRTWEKSKSVVMPAENEKINCYHPSVHKDGDRLTMYVWRSGGGENGLYRYESDDGRKFVRAPETPLFVSPWASDEAKKLAGNGRLSNDAFDVVPTKDGSWSYYAACIEKATDPRTIFKHDNAVGFLRFIGRSTSTDGISWSETEIVLRPDYEFASEWGQQFYGMQVFQYRGFWLGLLHTFYMQSQIIQPEWAWSHDGVSWARTRTPCISLGDEGTFDSRMILFGDIAQTDDEIIWLYSGYDWRHNAKGDLGASIGRATITRRDLDAWLDTLPSP